MENSLFQTIDLGQIPTVRRACVRGQGSILCLLECRRKHSNSVANGVHGLDYAIWYQMLYYSDTKYIMRGYVPFDIVLYGFA